MPLITFHPSGKSIIAESGSELLKAATLAGIEIETPCGGEGTCGKCVVKVISGEVNTDSSGYLSLEDIREGFVLSCKTKILDSTLTIELTEKLGSEGGQFSNSDEDISLVSKVLLPKSFEYNSLAKKILLIVQEPKTNDGLSDIDRVTRDLQNELGKNLIVFPLPVIRSVADVLRSQDGKVTITYIKDSDRFLIINIEPGDTTSELFGIAIDVGTTTISVQLISQHNGKALATVTDYNSQIKCGLDIISRINYAKRPERLQELRSLVLGTINKLIFHLCANKQIKSVDISDAVISGNTIMIHLLLGLIPEYIRLEPYTPTLLKTPYLVASEVGININPNSWIYFSPAVGSYVGGDITAGILCTDLATDTQNIHLFIDIGTNGEIVVGNSEFLMACACSAGPAFEGGGIDCGMRAAIGAIEKVEINPETGTPKYQTIGNVKPKGICGTGMISLLANLLLTGWIDNAGKFSRVKSSPSIKIAGKNGYYIVAVASESATGIPIQISELDIDNIIRAKAAIYSACSLMLKHIGITFNEIATIYIAGGFGRFVDLKLAATIGLIPELPVEKFKYIGNSSLIGSYMICISQAFKEKQNFIANRMTYIDLSNDPDYMNQYTAALFLPHTDMDLFPSVKSKNSTQIKSRH